MAIRNRKLYEKYISNLDKITSDDLRKIMNNLCEERNYFDYLLAHVSEAVCVVADDGSLSYVNESARHLFSKSIDENKHFLLRDLIDDDHLFRFIEKSIHERYRKLNAEYGMFVPHERLLNVSIIPLPDLRDGMHETLLVISDITDRKRLQHEQERNAKIQTLIDLTAGIAHEIGNPLNSIGIHLKILEQELQKIEPDRGNPLYGTLQVIGDETRRLDMIIKNFLEATRSRQMRITNVNFNDIVRAVCNLLRPEVERKHAQLVLRLDENMKKAQFDEEQIRRLLINVVKNAVEAITDDGLIEIETHVKEKVLYVSVKDDGVGISEENIDRIFDTYYTTKENGAGLGLMIVYTIVREHGGRIEVKSRPGEGTEFNIIFPLRREKLRLPKGVSKL